MAHVYISYAPDDFEYAELVQRRLERANFTVWIDTSSTEVPAGTLAAKDWRQEIDEAIRASFVVLTVITPRSRTFEYVSYEWMFALGVGITVIPLVFQQTELPQRLKAIQPLDFTNPRRPAWSLLLERVGVIQNRAVPATAQHTPHGADGSKAATLAGSGQARTLIDLVDIIRSGDYEKQRDALMALAELDPAALVRLVQNALKHDDIRIPFMQVLIDRTLPPPRHVFLSYSRTDTPLMCKLRDDLRHAGVSVWTDESLTPGDPSWQLAIQNAIEIAGCVIVMLSPDSAKSEWVLAELQYARLRKVVIVPVLVRGHETQAIPMALINWQWLDLRSEALYIKGLPQLVTALDGYLRKFNVAVVA
ncbi:MAG: TIR domain-containing protein [Anaerolineaceae bacterium]|nr:TIR domain-containing protein [Anaerolineaceae bacterium]